MMDEKTSFLDNLSMIELDIVESRAGVPASEFGNLSTTTLMRAMLSVAARRLGYQLSDDELDAIPVNKMDKILELAASKPPLVSGKLKELLAKLDALEAPELKNSENW